VVDLKKLYYKKTDSTTGREEKEKEKRERERQENEQRERDAREKLAREKSTTKASAPVKATTVDTVVSVSVTEENLKKEEERLLNAISMKRTSSFTKPAPKPVVSIQKEPEKKVVVPEKKTCYN